MGLRVVKPANELGLNFINFLEDNKVHYRIIDHNDNSSVFTFEIDIYDLIKIEDTPEFSILFNHIKNKDSNLLYEVKLSELYYPYYLILSDDTYINNWDYCIIRELQYIIDYFKGTIYVFTDIYKDFSKFKADLIRYNKDINELKTKGKIDFYLTAESLSFDLLNGLYRDRPEMELLIINLVFDFLISNKPF